MKKAVLDLCRSSVTRIIVGTTIIFSQTTCKKFGNPQDVYIYSDVAPSAAPVSLFLDGDFKGDLPNLHTQTRIDNDTILREALRLSLRPGKYKLIAKDNQGNERCDGWIKFSTNSVGSSSTKGGQSMAGGDNTTVIELSF